MLKRLESLGYISRRRNSQDERELSVELTEAGRALRDEAEQIPYAVVSRLGMSVDDLMALHGALGAVIAATDRVPE
jgi:DNA-binding MarR family transcriptional regulator